MMLLRWSISLFLLCGFYVTTASAETLTLVISSTENPGVFRMAKSVTNEIGRRSGDTIILMEFPGKRAIVQLQNGKVDGDLSRVSGFEKTVPGVLQVPTPIISFPYVVYTVDKEFDVKGWDSLKPYKVVHIRGIVLIDQKLKPIHDNLYEINSAKQALRFLNAGRADLFVGSMFTTTMLLNEPEFRKTKIKALQPPIDYVHEYTYFLPKHQEAAKRFEKALKSIKEDGTYLKLLRQKQ